MADPSYLGAVGNRAMPNQQSFIVRAACVNPSKLTGFWIYVLAPPTIWPND
jgi:hypothetical protein